MTAAGTDDTALEAYQEYSASPILDDVEAEMSGALYPKEFMLLLRHLDAAPASGAEYEKIQSIKALGRSIKSHSDTILHEPEEF